MCCVNDRNRRYARLTDEEEAARGNEVATIVGHAGLLAWCCDDVTGIAALHPSYGLMRCACLASARDQAGCELMIQILAR